MGQRGGRARLLFESPHPIGIGRERGRDDFDRDVAPEPWIVGPVDFAHSPGANQLEDLVGPDASAWAEGHGWGPILSGYEGNREALSSRRPVRPTRASQPPVGSDIMTLTPQFASHVTRGGTMLSIRTVLCPVDFSASTTHQVDLAVDLCRAFGARLILQHNKVELAIGVGVGWMWEPSHTGSALTPEQKLEELLASVPAGTDAEMRLTRGPIVDAVVTVSRAVDADLVVLSVRGGDTDGDDSITDRLLESALLPIFAVHDALHEHRTPKFAAPSGSPQALLVPTGLHSGLAARSGRGVRSVAPVCLRRTPAARVAEGRRRGRRPAQNGGTRAGRPAAPAAPARRDGHSRSRDSPRRRRRRRGLRRHGRARPHANASLVPFGYVEGGAASGSLSHLVRPQRRACVHRALTGSGDVAAPRRGVAGHGLSLLAVVVPACRGGFGRGGRVGAWRHDRGGHAARISCTPGTGRPGQPPSTPPAGTMGGWRDSGERWRRPRRSGTCSSNTPVKSRRGHVCIGIQIASPRRCACSTDILKQHGGHLISYFTVGSVQHLD